MADAVADVLRERDYRVERLDGDIVRKDLTRDLGFSKEDRDENIKRVTFVAKLLSRNGVAVLATFVSPYRERRRKTRDEIDKFVEVFVRCPVDVCIERDVKGMYKKALAGEITGFTGVDDPYEEPENPEVILHTDRETLKESAQKVLSHLQKLGYV